MDMKYLLSGTAIVAYDYKAATYCAEDMRNAALMEWGTIGCPSAELAERGSVEEVLDAWAARLRINREDERSFDQGEFPKVVFASQVEGPKRCIVCGENVLDRRS